VKEHFVHFAGIVKEELDGRNSLWRIREVSRAVGSCKGAEELRFKTFASRFARL
jgi:predicted metal-dependent hydrolase